MIGQLSGGIPRLINSICDNALLLAFAESSPVITEQHVIEVNRDLRLAPVEVRTERRYERVAERVKEQPAGALALKIPPPLAHAADSHPLSLFGNGKIRRSWWWPRLTKAQKA